jgi:hypothetical protein
MDFHRCPRCNGHVAIICDHGKHAEKCLHEFGACDYEYPRPDMDRRMSDDPQPRTVHNHGAQHLPD